MRGTKIVAIINMQCNINMNERLSVDTVDPGLMN